MHSRTFAAAVAFALALPAAHGEEPPLRGAGTGRSASTAPVTRSDETTSDAARLPARDLPIDPRHGLLGAPGAALDSDGPSRLGGHAERAQRSSYGEAAQGADIPDSWRSGDLARSKSSADVRAARQQQAPDLEWAGQGSGPPQKQPQEPYGVQYQNRPPTKR